MFLNLNKAQNCDYQPLFFDVKIEEQKKELIKVVESNKGITILDEMESQLKELIKLKHPNKKLTNEESDELIKIHLGSQSIDEYGVWVYYSWLNKIVHLLPEEEFIEVRTNRNHYKITPEEELELFQKKIGVIGLSVGKSIALTIALERICGELVLADFDEIELSNLNRIQTGVQNLGIKKTIVVAREIAEIDPYLKVTCLNEGVTEDNVDDFFLKGGKLSVCIEVCDGLSTKIFARQKAKEYRVPVLMNSSDRGTTDIERFDLDANLPILHGLIDHLDLSLLKKAKTNEEKVPYLLPMLGVETSSNRLKASMLEIEETITTWPQLASGVVFGGGICTDVCRRLLLGQIKNSGRYFVDIEDIINDEVKDYISADKVKKECINVIEETNKSDYQKLIDKYNESYSGLKSDNTLTIKEVKVLVEYASMAPSGGNIQPWKWIYSDDKLFLFSDKNRTKTILNYKNNANLISFGAATENLLLKAKELNVTVNFNKLPCNEYGGLIGVFYFSKHSITIEKDELSKYIPLRATNRSIAKGEPISEEHIEKLRKSILTIEGAELKIFQQESQLKQIQSVLTELDRIYLTSKKGHHHFVNEIRWNNKENELSKDGVDVETLDLTPTEKVGLVVAKNWEVTKYMKEWGVGNTFGKLTKKAIDSCAALGMIVLPKGEEHRFFDGGRALERVWLTATQNNIGIQPVSINAFLFERLERNDFVGIEELELDIKTLAQKLYSICGVQDSEQNVFFFRMLNGYEPSKRSLRRDVDKVLIYG